MGSDVDVAVLDEGVGISPDQADAMFDRFFQADEDRGGRRFGGLGLGLYITRAIVRTHGGEIAAQPNAEAGRGTMFRFSLPMTARVPDAFRITDAPPPFVTRRG